MKLYFKIKLVMVLLLSADCAFSESIEGKWGTPDHETGLGYLMYDNDKTSEVPVYGNNGLDKGNKSPKFFDYENYNGEKTSLDDFKGKIVYIDIWATWCRPCVNEIPYLMELEEKYRGKGIEFVSISVDEGEKGNKNWKKMVGDKEMSGVQLIADNARKSNFVSEYKVKSIPHFILIDSEGNIIDANAPRPSSKSIFTLLDGLIKK
ncbi:TlpA family protein disulfide reductase [Ichthyobacterium seriolicida]|uniref:Thiol:disulfide interchange protein n=1 Tax=Ichthyobacterium seriolicida TaxID=242600 RepID=A0A1J1E7K2_9FLAO|nr:TlpA disulfide reductase family protein [Ichthyobacterium seriolicida]BAV95310.1 thiol:disulfide interchange protein [Ichthyobacterium seriolicida]